MEIIKNREQFYRGTYWNSAQMDYFEELMKSDDYHDQIVCARMGYSLDRLMNHEEPLVRQAVALAGYGLVELAKDPRECVREAVAQNAAIVKLRPEVQEILLEDETIGVKCVLIDNGIGLDKFMADKDFLVRAYVAETGYGAETLRFDRTPSVRAGVAKALPEIQRHNPELAASIAHQLLYDADWYVRSCLATTGFYKAILEEDPVQAVRENALFAENKSLMDVGVKVMDDDGFRGEITRVHPSGHFYVSHELEDGYLPVADGWYPPERLKLANRDNERYIIAYLHEDGTGFQGGPLPFLLDSFDKDVGLVAENVAILERSGFKDVTVFLGSDKLPETIDWAFVKSHAVPVKAPQIDVIISKAQIQSDEAKKQRGILDKIFKDCFIKD